MPPATPRSTLGEAKARFRQEALGRLRFVARPDHRHHWDLAEFIADFEGSDRAVERLIETPEYVAADTVFVTPDNCLRRLRERVLRDRKRLLVATCGIGRGFLALDGASLEPAAAPLASTMEGADELATPVTLAEIARLWRPRLLVTGALAVTGDGLRLGKGRGYFDLEWAMFREVGAVAPDAVVAVVVHEVQVVLDGFPAGPNDVVADLVATPERLLRTGRSGPREARLDWRLIDGPKLAATPPLRELRVDTAHR